MKITLFYIPTPSGSSADLIGKTLIAEQLAACMHVFPVQSTYPWQGAIQSEDEFILLVKTLRHCEAQVTERVKQMHPYEVPAILRWRVNANEAYVDWMKTVIRVPEAID